MTEENKKKFDQYYNLVDENVSQLIQKANTSLVESDFDKFKYLYKELQKIDFKTARRRVVGISIKRASFLAPDLYNKLQKIVHNCNIDMMLAPIETLIKQLEEKYKIGILKEDDLDKFKLLYEEVQREDSKIVDRKVKLYISTRKRIYPQYNELYNKLCNVININLQITKDINQKFVSSLIDTKEKVRDIFNLLKEFDDVVCKRDYRNDIISFYKDSIQLKINEIRNLKNNLDEQSYNKIINSLSKCLNRCDEILSLIAEEEDIWKK